jgi:hypothetical protein
MIISRATPKIINTFANPKNSDSNGKYGNAIQNLYDSAGITTSHGSGNDIPELQLEIKSRDPVKNCHISVGSYKLIDVVNSNGKCMLKKMQKWNLHNHVGGVVTSTIYIDFTTIHNELTVEFDDLANQLRNDPLTKWTLAKTNNFIIERVSDDDDELIKLRIKSSKLNKLIHQSKTINQFNNLFTEG